ncbi:MAG: hypothetical protein SV062_01105 [Thermodesulfobacteriota bacterium]|nr:hypothetical protein [Thermodesulfobacteriota bacterium]
MMEAFESILHTLVNSTKGKGALSIINSTELFDENRIDEAGIVQSLNAAFLITLSGTKHEQSENARNFLIRMTDSPEWAYIARFYLKVKDLIHEEIKTICKNDSDFAYQIERVSDWLSKKENAGKADKLNEKIWSVFFPEGKDLCEENQDIVGDLRLKRTVTITELNPQPITDPARQILFTSNVLLTIPHASKSIDDMVLDRDLKEKIRQTILEPQIFWYDHPIQMGVEPEKNEVIYGLKGLGEALRFERTRRNASEHSKLTCVLSVSVTHKGLQNIARKYLEEELSRAGDPGDIDIYVFTEADTHRIIKEILVPVAGYYLGRDDAEGLLSIFGVDGEYGRHYSFLKAIAAFWKIFVQRELKGTFKIDLDQVFHQKKLVEDSGASAFEHFMTPLWGALGIDSNGRPVELGMIAGALVNKSDIDKSLFIPDVQYPKRELTPDEYVFFSILPQALSTEAEMMTRYESGKLDGRKACIQRFHVTGGTNGILIDSLRRYRPFTPSFIGRAEDQAYILSVLLQHSHARLAYVHKDGLIMSHDKEAFAQEAIQSAYIGKLLGDYVRILYFSSYARVLSNDFTTIKEATGPFTGCFMSRIPITVTNLRFALKAASFFMDGQADLCVKFVKSGVERITRALDFIRGENSMLKKLCHRERLGWDLYYDILSAVEEGLKNEDAFAKELLGKAKDILGQCFLHIDSI